AHGNSVHVGRSTRARCLEAHTEKVGTRRRGGSGIDAGVHQRIATGPAGRQVDLDVSARRPGRQRPSVRADKTDRANEGRLVADIGNLDVQGDHREVTSWPDACDCAAFVDARRTRFRCCGNSYQTAESIWSPGASLGDKPYLFQQEPKRI